jgi:hypothetical protein
MMTCRHPSTRKAKPMQNNQHIQHPDNILRLPEFIRNFEVEIMELEYTVATCSWSSAYTQLPA